MFIIASEKPFNRFPFPNNNNNERTTTTTITKISRKCVVYMCGAYCSYYTTHIVKIKQNLFILCVIWRKYAPSSTGGFHTVCALHSGKLPRKNNILFHKVLRCTLRFPAKSIELLMTTSSNACSGLA